MTRLEIIKKYIHEVFGKQDLELIPVSGDASFRKYYRIVIDNMPFIVMDSPPDKEPPDQFIKVTELLVNSNINVPNIKFKNVEEGILIITDFGDNNYLDSLSEETADNLYKEALDSLIEMQNIRPRLNIPIYDAALLSREMDLFDDWLIKAMLNINLTDNELRKLSDVKQTLIQNGLDQKQVFVHRDYHSRNLMVVKNRNPGIIDYQDAVIGPISYDLVSILKDCYIKWPLGKIQSWCEYFYNNNPLCSDLSFSQIMHEFHLMGVQRHLKASGIFARLKIRDDKPNYIQDIPRTLSYIAELDDIPKLLPLIEIIEEKVMPALENK